MLRRLGCVLLAATACGVPTTRVPLPVPFLPTTGATPVPGNGVVLGLEAGRGVLGPELARGEMRATSIGVGVNNLVSVWYGSPRSVGPGGTQVGVRQVRVKALVAKPLGWRSAMAVYGSHSWGERYAQGYAATSPYTVPTAEILQNDQVFSWEAAVPLEFLFGRRLAEARPSVYAGPRVTYVRYADAIRPDGSFTAIIPGALGGIHVSTHNSEFFVEGTLAYVPRHSFAGRAWGGYVAIMPSLGASLRIGSPFRW